MSNTLRMQYGIHGAIMRENTNTEKALVDKDWQKIEIDELGVWVKENQDKIDNVCQSSSYAVKNVVNGMKSIKE
jgi:hypothetical protein